MAKEITTAEYQALAELRYRIRKFVREGDAVAQTAGLEPQQYLLLLAIRGLPQGEAANVPGVLTRKGRYPVLSDGPVAELGEAREPGLKSQRSFSSQKWASFVRDREEQVFLILTMLIGAIVGMVVVAFILLTERFGARLYPAGGAAWRRLLVPVAGSAFMGYLLYRFFPDARGSGVPPTKAALYARGGRISLGTVFGKFFCTSATLASGIPLGREGPAVYVGAGSASVPAS